MNNKTYLVKLTPGSFFFFGGENSFGSGEGRNYLVRSSYFPQQTGMLGLLRYCLLQEAGLLLAPNDTGGLPDTAIALVGESSFQPDKTDGYGAIQRLSPVFLMDDKGQKVLPAALNWGMKLEATAGSRTSLGQTTGSAHILKDGAGEPFNPKNDLLEPLVNVGGEVVFYHKYDLEQWKQRKEKKEEYRRPWKEKEPVFRPHEQVGIKKDFRGTDDNAFYKQTSWHLPPDWCFACYVQLAEEGSLPTETLVTAGGERSLFRFQAEALEGSFAQNANFELPEAGLPADSMEKLVLVSDAYLPEAAMQHCAFAITQTTPFRYHRSDARRTKDFFDLETDPTSDRLHRPAKSQRFTLLKKGSVLYTKPGQRQALVDILNAQTSFRNIGYNYFVELPQATG